MPQDRPFFSQSGMKQAAPSGAESGSSGDRSDGGKRGSDLVVVARGDPHCLQHRTKCLVGDFHEFAGKRKIGRLDTDPLR